ncbi:hypothetical protein AaE_004353 [Aphanomyces astaci]|uniref:Uncharacterized protein n=1 Tax=Aphanomyces astaci TaxID=112090 RepID=A0A6A5ASD5_APHAT|nr:hypothetical protein AaE_004353 [Aphanomyces astaci]
MLDSLDAAFASKKPKIVPVSSNAPRKAAQFQPKSNKANKANKAGGALDVKMNHQAKARESVKQTEQKKDPPNPLYSKVDGLLYTTKTSKDKSRPPLKDLEEKLMALALIKQSQPSISRDESLLDKVKNKVLQLDNPRKAKSTTQTIPNPALQAQFIIHRRHTVRRKLGLVIPSLPINQDDAAELHRLWSAYMTDFLAEIVSTTSNAATIESFSACYYGPKLLKADFRGCDLRVVRSSNPTLVGTRGIVVEDQRNTFRMVSASGLLHCIPKSGHITFEFEVDGKAFRVSGDDFRSREYYS